MKTPNISRICNPLRVTLKPSARALTMGAWLVAGTALAAPANDDFANAIDLTGTGSGQTGDVLFGDQTGTDNVDATQETGETVGSGGVNTVWFKWTCPADGDLTVKTLGSTTSAPAEWDAVLGIYTGASVNALTALGGSPQDGNVPEEMTVPVTAGTTYHIQTAGYNADVAANILLTWDFVETIYQADILTFGPGAVIDPVVGNEANITWAVPEGTIPGTFSPTFTLSPGATCTVNSSPVVSGDPVDFSGGPVVFTVTALGDSPIVNNYTVTVTVATAVLWDAPGGSGDWDFTTLNWLGQASGLPTTFANGDEVTFNNTVGGTIYIPSAVLPLATTVSNGDYTFSGGPIAGTGSLTKGGSGTLTLDGANTYSGNTAVNAGTLEANGNSAVGGSTSFTVADGATLLLSGTTAGYKWPAAAAALTGAGTVSIPLGGPVNIGLNFDMSAFTGILDIANGMIAVNPYYSPSFVSPANGTIRVENNTTLYLGWTGFTLNTTVELVGGTDNGEGYGVLRGDNATITGAVILGTNSTIGCAGGTFTINAVISDGGNGFGFTKVKDGTVVLAATNTYNGPTVVNSGTLKCDVPGALGAGDLSITGAKVNLNYTGTKTIASLTLGGSPQTAPGTYGSSFSGADYPDDTYFTDTGTGTVTVSDGSGYADWATLYAGGQTPGEDYNNDGVQNGIAYFMGMDGLATNPSVVDGKVTWPSVGGVTSFEVQVSDNLGTWVAAAPGDVDTSTPGLVIYTLPTGESKKFCRLTVTP
ncbi:MAG: autotransporter-associated beta strand repeat-containing protein [Akkermansiaceae bacterium]|nr:autotransporter-associated beta strand repeat-containing protein [Akkermansiaceae bacterium]